MVESTANAVPDKEEVKVEVPDCVVNDLVHNYEPTLEDTFFIIPSGDYQRLIF